jgi:hypothetical protein
MKDSTTDNPDKARHLNGPQYSNQVYQPGEVVIGMTRGKSTMIGNEARSNHKTVLEHKVVNETKRTERNSEAMPARKAFSTMAKSGYFQNPNAAGNVVSKKLYSKDEKDF